ncbi:MAG: methionine--tRNA ligase subunit beta, partial [Clostridiales bacterium]|nr:methionine--tRNA ligase subunit beta [Clostridiales bacterium]
EIWVFIKRLNKFAHESEPWKLAKANKGAEFAGVMRVLAEGLRISAVLVSPFMPGSSKAILDRLALPEESRTWESAKRFDIVKSGEVAKGSPIFPRIDVKAELAFLEGQAPKKEEPKQEEKKEEKKEEAPSEQVPGIIAFDDFAKLDLKVGLVTECEKVKGSDKLLKSQVKLGDETRQIVSGIAKWYTPEEMVGKLVVLVANLKPVKLKGQLSEGMLLAAEGKDGTISLVTVDKPVEDGSEVS